MMDSLPNDEELKRMTGIGDAKDTAEQMFEEALLPSVQSIIDIATTAENVSMRLSAAKYIVDYNFSRLSSQLPPEWKRLMETIVEKSAKQ